VKELCVFFSQGPHLLSVGLLFGVGRGKVVQDAFPGLHKAVSQGQNIIKLLYHIASA
jgi:hypothetical protein